MGLKTRLDELPKNRSPIMGNGEVIFIYKGDAEKVYLAGEYNRWEPEDKLVRLENSSLWYIEKTFPENARFEYKYIVDGRWIADPLNEQTDPGGSGNSILVMPGYRSSYEAILAKTVPKGSLIKDIIYGSRYLNKKMRYHVYLPPDYKKGCNTILYALDGSDYLNFANIDRILDYMIDKREIPSSVAVLVDPDDRNTEYTVYEPYCSYVMNELAPAVENEYLSPESGFVRQIPERSVIGVSWGGLTALYLAFKTPFAFGRVLSQSGSFWPKDWLIFGMAEKAAAHTIRFCIQTGTIEDTEEMNDAMVALLKANGQHVNYMKYA